MLTAVLIKENGIKTRSMGKVYKLTRIKVFTKVNGAIIKGTDMVNKLILMEIVTRANGLRTHSKENKNDKF